MATYGDQARETLLDSAEELFARHGIDAVSNRTIADHAGTANHSAVGYHFGGRTELLRALATRNHADMLDRRRELLAGLSDDCPLRDIVAANIIPWVDVLDSLPAPSWRARFMRQVVSTPSVMDSLRAEPTPPEDSMRLDAMLPDSLPELQDVPRNVLRNRSRLVEGLALDACAGYEARLADGSVASNWLNVGYFLIDAASGMLAAPVTRPSDFLTPASPSVLSL